MWWIRVVVAVVLASLAGGCAMHPADVMGDDDRAPAAAADFLPDSSIPTPVPAGFISFCIRFSGQCELKPEAPASVFLTDAAWRTLNIVNRTVNESIWPEHDIVHYDRADFWTIPTDGYGDCDDYAVTKRQALIYAGFPAPALRLAVVYSPRVDRHAVLTVTTDKGDFVLDNMRNDIVPWDATGYTWIERQDPARPLGWVSLLPSMAMKSVAATGSVTEIRPEQSNSMNHANRNDGARLDRASLF